MALDLVLILEASVIDGPALCPHQDELTDSNARNDLERSAGHIAHLENLTIRDNDVTSSAPLTCFNYALQFFGSTQPGTITFKGNRCDGTPNGGSAIIFDDRGSMQHQSVVVEDNMIGSTASSLDAGHHPTLVGKAR